MFYFHKGNNIDLNPNGATPFKRPIADQGLDYSVFCLHANWNHTTVGELIGDQGSNAKYFSIVRDPVDIFVSIWDYYGFSKAFRMDLETFATKTNNNFKERTDRRIKGEGQNMMLFDFGLPVGSLNNDSAVAAKISEIEANFDLIMVMEHFDESLVLLRELLCWEWEDMTYIKLNSWQESQRSPLSPKGRAILKNWLRGDYLLYNHFKKRFDQSIRNYKGNMDQDLKILNSANRDIKTECVKYTVNTLNKKCVDHTTSALRFINYIRNKQSSQ